MKSSKIYILLFALFIGNISFANHTDWYYITIKNNLRYQLELVDKYDKNCIQDTSREDKYISSNFTVSNAIRIQSKGDWGANASITCGSGADRSIKYVYKVLVNDRYGNFIGSADSDYYVEIRFWHKKRDGTWETKIQESKESSGKYGTKETRPAGLTDAECINGLSGTAKGCLDSWVKQQKSDNNITVTIDARDELLHGYYKFASLNLGDTYVTDPRGKPADVEPISQAINLSGNNTLTDYNIYFQKSPDWCRVRSGDITCPDSIAYYYLKNDEKTVFSCRQASSKTPACPWTIKKDRNNHYSLG